MCKIFIDPLILIKIVWKKNIVEGIYYRPRKLLLTWRHALILRATYKLLTYQTQFTLYIDDAVALLFFTVIFYRPVE